MLNWLAGSPRRFKTFVGNRISLITDLVAPNRWHHVQSSENPADCASRGVLPSELLHHHLWWDGPDWLQMGMHCWPKSFINPSDEVHEICTHAAVVQIRPVFQMDRFSSFSRLKRVTAWMIRFVSNCRAHQRDFPQVSGQLTLNELCKAVSYWVCISQAAHFKTEVKALKSGTLLPRSCSLISLNVFLDEDGLLRVGGRQQNSRLSYDRQHPIILHGTHPVSKLLIHAKHLRLLHAGPLLVSASLGRHFHIVGGRRAIRSITRRCVICHRKSLRPQPPLMGQLPAERVTPDLVFNRVGIDYAGPICTKYGHVRKPTLVKSYVCVFCFTFSKSCAP